MCIRDRSHGAAARLRHSHVARRVAGVAAIAATEMPGELRARLAVKSKVVISMVQILALLAPAFDIAWPANYAYVVSHLGAVVNINPLSMLGLECVDAGYDWHASLLQTCAFPAAVVLALLLLRQLALWRCRPPPAAKEPLVARFCATGVSGLLLLVFPRTAAAIFSAFHCDSFDTGDGRPPLRMLHADLSISCDLARHRRILVFARVMIALSPAGVPLFFALLLARARGPMRQLINASALVRHAPPGSLDGPDGAHPARAAGVEAIPERADATERSGDDHGGGALSLIHI